MRLNYVDVIEVLESVNLDIEHVLESAFHRERTHVRNTPKEFIKSSKSRAQRDGLQTPQISGRLDVWGCYTDI
jgi:hypothetical protein